MKRVNDKIIIGIDHGYGNIKTANHCFKTAIAGFDEEPLFTRDMLTYNGRYYLIGEGHKEYIANKVSDEDYYLLTLAAIAQELAVESITEADVIIAAGLPLSWVGSQKAEFKKYLAKNETVEFSYRKTDYKIHISDVLIYPQGYAAVAEVVSTLKGISVVADIGNGTMNTLFLENGRPLVQKMFTEKFGTHQCTLAVREEFMRRTQRELPDFVLDEVLRCGKAEIPSGDNKIIRETAAEYVRGIFRRLREHGYDENTMMLYVCGGGGCLVCNFSKCSASRVKFVDDICAAAKGYEYMAELQLRR